MTDWLGTGSTITGATTGACVEYLTIAQVQAEFGDDVSDFTDGQIQRKIDMLVSELEEQLGHGFGRAMIASSTGTDAVAVTATKLTIGGVDYAFATYTTLAALEAAVNGAGADYGLELLPHIHPHTPSTLLETLSSTACGPDYEDRQVLCISAMWLRLSGDGTSHLFLPLPLAGVTTVTENASTLDATAYWYVAGESWLIRKKCTCATSASCAHPRGWWSKYYPGNITVEYTPYLWGKAPASLRGLLLEAFGSQAAVGSSGLESESFGEYSYRRAKAQVYSWQDTLGSAGVRRYAVKFHP